MGDPQPVCGTTLPGGRYEVRAAVAGRPRALRLEATEATRDAVLAAIGDYSLLHFACHGTADPFEPMASSLLLSGDERMTVRDLWQRQAAVARLAVLSACETAMLGRRLPDETIGMPAALMQTSVAGVVAGPWRLPDLAAMQILVRFHTMWRETGGEPAEALRRAQQWVRDSTNEVKQRYFPDVPELAGQHVSAVARPLWATARAYASPAHWTGFTVTGV